MLEFGGQDLSDYLVKSLFKEDSKVNKLFQLQTVDAIKMTKCFVLQNLVEALAYRQNLPSGYDDSNSYVLPDGTLLELTPMQRLAPETFFSPQMFNQERPSISQAVLDSINACNIALQPQLMTHMIACGGNTPYPGFTLRLFLQLAPHYPSCTDASFSERDWARVGLAGIGILSSWGMF
ncbi:Actin-like protein 8 [Myotis davidii]|uniref:Actin-like protein 8 n=1 Tax=Myotis davidii TaxID=225400 RepID=L5LIL4_MYODS|nr:Actin-like protein 8 [Myotis davidii]